MSFDLNNDSEIKLLIKLKIKKDSLNTDKVFFATIRKNENHEYKQRLITILDDNLTRFEYYYELNGQTFNNEIEVLNSQIIGGGVKGEKLKEDITKKNNFEYNYIFYIQNLIKVYLCVLTSLSLSINLKSSLNKLYFDFINCFIIHNQGLFLLLGSPTAFILLNENHFLISGINIIILFWISSFLSNS